MRKQLLSVLLILCLALAALPASAAGALEIAAGQASGAAGETVEVPVSLAHNPGLVSLTLHADFDPALELIAVRDCGALGAQAHKPELSAPYTFAWVNDTATQNFTANGEVAVLTFRISESAAPGAVLPVTLSCNSAAYECYDKDLNAVPVSVVNGGVTVTEAPAYVWGDPSGDGKISLEDAVYILKYLADLIDESELNIHAADVDRQNGVTMSDAVYLLKYLADLAPAL